MVMDKELDIQIVKGKVAEFAILSAKLNDVSIEKLSEILKEIVNLLNK